MEMVNLKINNVPCKAPAGATILEAAHEIGITIPTLCYLKEIQRVNGACRVCVVEVKGPRTCCPPASTGERGHEVFTGTPKVQAAPQDQPGAHPLHPQPGLHELRAQRRLRAAAAVQAVRRG